MYSQTTKENSCNVEYNTGKPYTKEVAKTFSCGATEQRYQIKRKQNNPSIVPSISDLDCKTLVVQ